MPAEHRSRSCPKQCPWPGRMIWRATASDRGTPRGIPGLGLLRGLGLPGPDTVAQARRTPVQCRPTARRGEGLAEVRRGAGVGGLLGYLHRRCHPCINRSALGKAANIELLKSVKLVSSCRASKARWLEFCVVVWQTSCRRRRFTSQTRLAGTSTQISFIQVQRVCPLPLASGRPCSSM
jgi:hypothetical protein